MPAIEIKDNEAATFTHEYTGDLWWCYVVYNNLFIPSRNSYLKINGTVQQSLSTLQGRFDTPLVDPTIEVSIHERDLAPLHPGNGRRLCILAMYDKNKVFSFQYLDIDVKRNTLKGTLRWIGVSTLGGFLKYEEVAEEVEQATIIWTTGASSTIDLTPSEGIIWVPAPDSGDVGSFSDGFSTGFDIAGQGDNSAALKPTSISLQGTVDSVLVSSPNLIRSDAVTQYAIELPSSTLMPWPLPPRIDRTSEGFKPFFDAFEAGLDLNPEEIGQELNPAEANKRYLDDFIDLFGITAQPGESIATRRTRLLNILRKGKDTPLVMKDILELVLGVKVSILDSTDDSSIVTGRFSITLDATPSIGLLATLLTIRQLRSAGHSPDIQILTNPTADIMAISYKFASQFTMRFDLPCDAFLGGTPIKFDGSRKFDGTWSFGRGAFTTITIN